MRSTLLWALAAACLIGFTGCLEYERPGDKGSRGTSADRRRRADNLKIIALAAHDYHDAYKSFPPHAICDPGGTPLLSWRVALLPYLRPVEGESPQALYKEFHLDEPWDSPHNSRLLKRMPEVYAGGRGTGEGTTSIMVFTGEATPFAGPQPPRMADIRDGTSNTIFCVDAGPDKVVPWTKPEDLPFDWSDPLASLGKISEEKVLAAFFDGSVRDVPRDIDPGGLRLLVCHNDGLRVWGPKYEPSGGRAAGPAGSPKRATIPATDTELIGGSGGAPFRLIDPRGRPTVGVRYRLGSWAGRQMLGRLEPLFGGEGESHGFESVRARAGYAVGALQVDADEFVNAVQVVFMRIDGERLDPSDSYTSEWLGVHTGNEPRTVGGTGARVLGIHGRQVAILDAVGLVLEKP